MQCGVKEEVVKTVNDEEGQTQEGTAKQIPWDDAHRQPVKLV